MSDMTDQELMELEARDPRAAQIEAIKIVFRCSRKRAEEMWERVRATASGMPRIIRGGDWENMGEDYLTTTFHSDLESDEHTDMGFRTFRLCRVRPVVGPFRA